MVVYLPSLFVYYVHPGQWWVMGILSIGFPYTWVAFVLAVWLGFKKNKRLGWLLLLLWCAGLLVMQYVIALHSPKKFAMQKPAGTLRIMQWNCMELAGFDKANVNFKQARFEAVQWIRKSNPDIILMQDFHDYQSKYFWSSIALFRDTLGYKYYYYKPYLYEQQAWGNSTEGVAIFSKLPLIDSGSVQYTGKKYPSYIVWATVLFNHKPMRIATTHFTSMNLNSGKTSVDSLNYVQKPDSVVLTSGSTWKKLQYYQPYHVLQASMLRTFVDSSSLPVIVGADLNSVPSSYVYRLLKGNMHDAFLYAGSGIGTTYFSMLPSLRIDYLFMDDVFKIIQLERSYLRISDHLFLLADVTWK